MPSGRKFQVLLLLAGIKSCSSLLEPVSALTWIEFMVNARNGMIVVMRLCRISSFECYVKMVETETQTYFLHRYFMARVTQFWWVALTLDLLGWTDLLKTMC